MSEKHECIHEGELAVAQSDIKNLQDTYKRVESKIAELKDSLADLSQDSATHNTWAKARVDTICKSIEEYQIKVSDMIKHIQQVTNDANVKDIKTSTTLSAISRSKDITDSQLADNTKAICAINSEIEKLKSFIKGAAYIIGILYAVLVALSPIGLLVVEKIITILKNI